MSTPSNVDLTRSYCIIVLHVTAQRAGYFYVHKHQTCLRELFKQNLNTSDSVYLTGKFYHPMTSQCSLILLIEAQTSAFYSVRGVTRGSRAFDFARITRKKQLGVKVIYNLGHIPRDQSNPNWKVDAHSQNKLRHPPFPLSNVVNRGEATFGILA